jgi:glucan phosphoethanolaminetransferase (alkaline phosphatase superfamily)
MSARTARLTFGLAGIYGLIVLTPFFFLEARIAAATPGGLTHVEYYYGFLGAASVMQLVYLAIARDPVRLRPLMPLCALAKLAFFLPVLILWAQGRAPAALLEFASIDAVLAAAFVHAWRVTPAEQGA